MDENMLDVNLEDVTGIGGKTKPLAPSISSETGCTSFLSK
jgi:hypothetical protein